MTLKQVQRASFGIAPAHRGRARGGARARGGRARARARARARRAALGAGRGHLQGNAVISNMHEVMCLWLASALSGICSEQAFTWRQRTVVVLVVVLVFVVVVLVLVVVLVVLS